MNIDNKVDMVVLAKNNPKLFIIKKDKAKEFIDESNKNKITEDFLNECLKTIDLFKGDIL